MRKRAYAMLIFWLLGLVLTGGGVWTYLKTAKKLVIDNLPIEFEIERARTIVDELVPEIRKNLQLIAREEVAMEQLSEQLSDAEQKLAKEKADILRLKADLGKGRESYVYSGNRYTGEQLNHEITTKFERFKRNNADYQNLCKMRDDHARRLNSARRTLGRMLDDKRELESDIMQLESRLRLIEVAQTTSDSQFHNSKLAQAKELINEIRTRLKVAERVVNADVASFWGIELDDRQTADIAREIDEYLFAEESFNPVPN